MLSVIKQIIACLVIASLVATACYFLPFVNSLFSDYLIGFFLAAFVLPIGLKWYEVHMTKVRAMPENERIRKYIGRSEAMREADEVTTCLSNCHDLRNIDQQHHVLNGFKD